MQGKILSTVGGVYVVYSNGINYRLFPKGIFRHKNQKLLVGDDVLFNDEEMVIEYIEERKNELIRPKVANIDTIFVTMSVVETDLNRSVRNQAVRISLDSPCRLRPTAIVMLVQEMPFGP